MYNGYKNWNQWNVSLWINNDHGLYRMAVSHVRRAKNKDIAAERIAEELQGVKTPDGAIFSKTAIRAAIVGM